MNKYKFFSTQSGHHKFILVTLNFSGAVVCLLQARQTLNLSILHYTTNTQHRDSGIGPFYSIIQFDLRKLKSMEIM
jgi:hypothetical protein